MMGGSTNEFLDGCAGSMDSGGAHSSCPMSDLSLSVGRDRIEGWRTYLTTENSKLLCLCSDVVLNVEAMSERLLSERYRLEEIGVDRRGNGEEKDLEQHWACH